MRTSKFEDNVFREVDNLQKQQRYYIVKLTCGHGNIEIKKTEDQIIVCPTCHKRFALIWATVEKARKIREVEGRNS